MVKKLKLFLYSAALLFLLLLIGMNICRICESARLKKALFSWKDSAMSEDIFALLKEQRISSLYQHISVKMNKQTVMEFLTEASAQKVDVFLLAGEPEWALEASGESLSEAVDRAACYNRSLPEDAAIRGIVFDVEPYLLPQWDENSKASIMERYIENMKNAYQKAADQQLLVILCIPYFYDTMGLEEQLQVLISSCCDKAAVMNYYRDKEKEHIETEAAYAAASLKELINIYELQPAGDHGLTERNTYYEQGLNAAVVNFKGLMKAFPRQNLSMALHDYETLKEITRYE